MTMHGRRLRRFTALLTGGALVGGALLAAPIGAAAPAAAADGTTITPNPAYAGEAFEGWGTSLVWFANATGGYPEELREQLYQAVFGEDGLDLNIARYNIGGGNASDVQDYLRPGGAVDGWWAADPDGSAGTLRRHDHEVRRPQRAAREVGRRRPGVVRLVGRRDAALVGRAARRRRPDHALGDVRQLGAVLHDRERLRLGRLQRLVRAAEARRRGAVRELPRARHRAPRGRVRHRRRHASTRSTSRTPTTGAPR